MEFFQQQHDWRAERQVGTERTTCFVSVEIFTLVVC